MKTTTTITTTESTELSISQLMGAVRDSGRLLTNNFNEFHNNMKYENKKMEEKRATEYKMYFNMDPIDEYDILLSNSGDYCESKFKDEFTFCIDMLKEYGFKIYDWHFDNNPDQDMVAKFMCSNGDWFFSCVLYEDGSFCLEYPYDSKYGYEISKKVDLASCNVTQIYYLINMLSSNYDTFYEQTIQHIYELPGKLEKEGYRVTHNLDFDIFPDEWNVIQMLNSKSQKIYLNFHTDDTGLYVCVTDGITKYEYDTLFTTVTHKDHFYVLYDSDDNYPNLIKMIKDYETVRFSKQFGYFNSDDNKYYNHHNLVTLFNKWSDGFRNKHLNSYYESHGTPYMEIVEPDLETGKLIDVKFTFWFYDYMNENCDNTYSYTINFEYTEDNACVVTFTVNDGYDTCHTVVDGSFAPMVEGIKQFIESVYQAYGCPLKVFH